MRSTQQLSVTLPNEMAQMVKAKVSSGEYGLRALQAREKALEAWLRTDAAAAYDDMKARPDKGLSADEVVASLKSETERQTKAR